MTTDRTMTARIVRTYQRAPESCLIAGATWYATAHNLALELADTHDIDVVRVAIAMAHLSPNNTWAGNVTAIRRLLAGGIRCTMVREWDKANAALTVADPWSTFGFGSPKTRAFAHAILGSTDAVVIDRWAVRVTGEDERILGRKGGYERVADAYRRAARTLGTDPVTVQAVTWCAVRGRAA